MTSSTATDELLPSPPPEGHTGCETLRQRFQRVQREWPVVRDTAAQPQMPIAEVREFLREVGASTDGQRADVLQRWFMLHGPLVDGVNSLPPVRAVDYAAWEEHEFLSFWFDTTVSDACTCWWVMQDGSAVSDATLARLIASGRTAAHPATRTPIRTVVYDNARALQLRAWAERHAGDLLDERHERYIHTWHEESAMLNVDALRHMMLATRAGDGEFMGSAIAAVKKARAVEAGREARREMLVADVRRRGSGGAAAGTVPAAAALTFTREGIPAALAVRRQMVQQQQRHVSLDGDNTGIAVHADAESAELTHEDAESTEAPVEPVHNDTEAAVRDVTADSAEALRRLARSGMATRRLLSGRPSWLTRRVQYYHVVPPDSAVADAIADSDAEDDDVVEGLAALVDTTGDTEMEVSVWQALSNTLTISDDIPPAERDNLIAAHAMQMEEARQAATQTIDHRFATVGRLHRDETDRKDRDDELEEEKEHGVAEDAEASTAIATEDAEASTAIATEDAEASTAIATEDAGADMEDAGENTGVAGAIGSDEAHGVATHDPRG